MNKGKNYYGFFGKQYKQFSLFMLVLFELSKTIPYCYSVTAIYIIVIERVCLRVLSVHVRSQEETACRRAMKFL